MAEAAPQSFAVALPTFEGPLDLLLSLIQEHKLDIFDIPISLRRRRSTSISPANIS